MRIILSKVFMRILGSIFLITVLLGHTSLAEAQILDTIEIPSSPNPVGSGARALGMGGAFIAVADDATAASWNPGGLIQLERPEISVVGSYFDRSIDTSFQDFPEASGEHSISEERLNYFSISYPFERFNRNMTLSLNYQDLYDFTNKWNFPIYQSADDLVITQEIDAEQEGHLSALGLAYCFGITHDLAVGVTFNLWQEGLLNSNQWEYTTHRRVSGSFFGFPVTGEGFSKDTYEFSGYNFNIGVLWDMNSKWTFGAVFKTPFTADLTHARYFSESIRLPQNPGNDIEAESYKVTEEQLEMPMSYGIGVAYRMSDNFTMSADIYRTEWGDYVHENADGIRTSPITGAPENEADIDATHQVRLGAEYLFIRPKYAIPLRGGVFYDPAPAQGSPDDFFGVSVGSGIAYKRYIFDFAIQYRFGDDVGESVSENLRTSQDFEEYTFYSSIIIHF